MCLAASKRKVKNGPYVLLDEGDYDLLHLVQQSVTIDRRKTALSLSGRAGGTEFL